MNHTRTQHNPLRVFAMIIHSNGVLNMWMFSSSNEVPLLWSSICNMSDSSCGWPCTPGCPCTAAFAAPTAGCGWPVGGGPLVLWPGSPGWLGFCQPHIPRKMKGKRIIVMSRFYGNDFIIVGVSGTLLQIKHCESIQKRVKRASSTNIFFLMVRLTFASIFLFIEIKMRIAYLNFFSSKYCLRFPTLMYA